VPSVELFVIVADYQVLTDRDVADRLTETVEELVLDYLAVGIDPERATVFTHSAVPALNQLLLPFLSLVTMPELQLARRFNERYGPVFPEPDALLSAAPVLLGTDGTKMSKSRNNAISIGATADQTARLLKTARTDADPHITYDSVNRPEVSSLVLLAALCLDRSPEDVAASIGHGAAALTEVRAAMGMTY
jgi:tryptophanyl-tRNA synthetase